MLRGGKGLAGRAESVEFELYSRACTVIRTRNPHRTDLRRSETAACAAEHIPAVTEGVVCVHISPGLLLGVPAARAASDDREHHNQRYDYDQGSEDDPRSDIPHVNHVRPVESRCQPPRDSPPWP